MGGKRYILRVHDAYQNFRPFTDEEAWMLFRLAAFGEAIGWTLLIIGILIDQTSVSWHEIPVKITGQIHGMLFLAYAAAALVLSPSLGWSWFRAIVAGLASVPPYGSLLFGMWSAHGRKYRDFTNLRRLLLLKLSMPEAEL
jgi:integral membrane protein